MSAGEQTGRQGNRLSGHHRHIAIRCEGTELP